MFRRQVIALPAAASLAQPLQSSASSSATATSAASNTRPVNSAGTTAEVIGTLQPYAVRELRTERESAKKIGPETLRKQRPALTTTRRNRAMDYRPLPPVEFLRNCFLYEPETGALTWRVRPRDMFETAKGWRIANVKFAGKPALACRTKYGLTGSLQYEGEWLEVKTGRVAYAIHHGREPDGFVDHINGNPFDNRADNLRVVTKQQNNANKARRKSSRPYQGVYFRKGKWVASIRYQRKDYWLGSFTSVEAAICARKEAEQKFGFHPNHGRAAAP